MKKMRDTFDSEVLASTFAVFADQDELFDYSKEFKNDSLTYFNNTDNIGFIHGTHEVAKNMNSLRETFN